MTNYSRTYIPNYAELTTPLYDLMDIKNVMTKKKWRTEWEKSNLEMDPKTTQAFEKLVEIMCSDLILKLANFELDFQVTCDASDLGYGSVLEQELHLIGTQLLNIRKRITLHRDGSRKLVCVLIRSKIHCIPTINRSPVF